MKKLLSEAFIKETEARNKRVEEILAEQEFKAKIEKAIKEYMERMVKAYKIRESNSSDYCIDCPSCHIKRTIKFDIYHKRWQCMIDKCRYLLPHNISPPSFNEIEELIVLKRHLKFIKEWWYLFE